MEDVLSRFKDRTTDLTRLNLLGAEAQVLLNDMLVHLEMLEQRNALLRRALRNSTKIPRMSSKLKDALYE